MNFLAHVYLSGDSPKIMVGNFIGDFVKGRNLSERYEADIVKGIELHRGIDEFTDNHSVVTTSKERLRPKYRHYSPVIVDMFYDHILARNWSDYHPTALSVYASKTYQTLLQFDSILPQTVKHMLSYMIDGNWLFNYAKMEGIQRALSGMARRTPFHSNMEHAVNDLRDHYDDFEREFRLFFPDLKKFAEDFLT